MNTSDLITTALTSLMCGMVVLWTAYFAYRVADHIIVAIKKQIDESYANQIVDKVIKAIKELRDNDGEK